ncbi:MAG: uracil-DNA glycosylase [Terriglobia bacterium]
MTESAPSRNPLERLQQRIIACARCPRLVEYREKVAREKRRMYRGEAYWGKPLPGFGDPEAALLVVGLAPAAHGGNRTGRMFTGDRSGDFLYRALYESGFANQPLSARRGDGLTLCNCYITAGVRCAPPANKPTPEEQRNCRPYLMEELAILRKLRAVLALGRIAFDAYLRVVYEERGSGPRIGKVGPHRVQLPRRSSFRFAHGASFILPDGLPRLYAAYHPSQQNTQTGRLTPEMFRRVLEDIRNFLAEG